ncbi:MAG: GAF domain-containing protein [Verrucomicrobia bacterium]|nr:GAF domain-containing protein [Verrucomicrobiota bacterium]
MAREPTSLSDTDLRDGILAGLAATAELEARFRQPLERLLVGMCDRTDGRSQEKAVEIAGQILAECFVKSPSLLERWQGGDNLEAFLRTAAANRLKSWWASAEKKRTEVNSESLSLAHAAMPAAEVDKVDKEAVAMAEHALRAGVAAAAREYPEGLVFLRLKGLYGVEQRIISQCWGHHEAQTGRWIKEAMALIRATAVSTAEATGCELTPDLLQQALQHDPAVLLGRPGAGGQPEHDESLKLLAAGTADAKTRRQAVAVLCQDPASLGFFARLLNRRDEREALVVRDPELADMGVRLAECVRRSLAILQPAEAAALVTPLMSAWFADSLGQVGADGGTLWLLRPEGAALEAVFNPLEPEIAGKRQPLVSGIVSLVLATGEPACVSAAVGHVRHSPAIDIVLGKTTRAMIAVPFVLAGSVRGVLTAVRFTRDAAFGESETRSVKRCADILATLLVQNLTARILG